MLQKSKIPLFFSRLTIGVGSRVITNDPGDLGSIPGRVIPKTKKKKKKLLDSSLLNTQHYKVWIKGKWISPGKGIMPSSTLGCHSYCKGFKYSYNTNNYCVRLIDQVGRMFANSQGDLGSIPGCVIQKTLEMVLDTSLLNTQHYKVRIKGKVEQYREWSSALPYTSV